MILNSDFRQLRKVSYAIKNSSTNILPRWYQVLDELNLVSRMLPRDVTTRWNSTYDMLVVANEYRAALDTITGDRDLKLRKFELTTEEWGVAKQLEDVLKVCMLHSYD